MRPVNTSGAHSVHNLAGSGAGGWKANGDLPGPVDFPVHISLGIRHGESATPTDPELVVGDIFP